MTKEIKTLLLVFALALFLRTFQLSIYPFGFHVDEAKVGWNALSILTTGKDDNGNNFPLYYNSFGDFRPTGIFYATIPSLIAFGRSEFAVRFPSALFGAITIFPLYFLTKELSKKRSFSFKFKNLELQVESIAALLLTFSPWHIAVSRATSEVVVSLFFALVGVYFFVRGINKSQLTSLVLSLVFLILSYFFYHSVRLLAPLFILATIFYFWQEIKVKKLIQPVFAVFAFLALGTFILSLDKQARGRFSQVSIFSDLDVQYELSRMPFEEGQNNVFVARLFHNKPLVYARRFVIEYTKYFSSDFFLNSTTAKPARYQTVGVGLLTYAELALAVLGIIALIQTKNGYSFLPLLLVLLSPLPAALTTEDAPNLHRALFMIPFLVILEAYGVFWVNARLGRYPILTGLLSILFAGNFIFFGHMYLVHNKVHLPLYRNVGAKDLALYLNSVQGNYDKIVITDIPDNPYPWIAFFTGRDPRIFNQDAQHKDQGVWTSGNFVFTGQRCPSRDAFEKPDVKKLLVVDAEGCASESKLKNRSDVALIKTIERPDNSEVYTIWSRVEN